MRPVLRAAAALALLVACGDDPTQPQYDPQLDPADFVPQVTNQFFPLVPGTTYSYEGETDEGTETTVVEVLDETKTILGITATVVRDRVFLDGELIEDTFDWYAQQNTGDVWYLGEVEGDRKRRGGQHSRIVTPASVWACPGCVPGGRRSGPTLVADRPIS